MVRQKLKSLITSFIPDDDYLAILYPNGTVKIWSTCTGSLFAEWKQSDGGPVSYSFMACGFVGKKRKKEERDTCLLALGTNDGDILVVNVLTGEKKWNSTGENRSGLVGLSFANKGHSLHIVGTDGMASEMNSETGEVILQFKASKAPITSSAFSCGEKIFAVASNRIRVLSMENGKKLLKFPGDPGAVQYISISDDAKAILISEFGEKHLQVWTFDLNSKTSSRGPVLSMRRPPLSFECKNGYDGERGLFVLAVSDSGVAYIWNLNTISQDEVNPKKITVKAKPSEVYQNTANAKKNRINIIAARLCAIQPDKAVSVLISYGSIDSPQFDHVNVSDPGEDIVITAKYETEIVPDGFLARTGLPNSDLEATVNPDKNRKTNKKRAASDPDLATSIDMTDLGNEEAMDGVLADDDLNEPTMGEKLASLNLLENGKTNSPEKQESSPSAKPPSADSVNVLLKQALHADDRSLLLDCLYTQEDKVIANSISLLNLSDVLKLYHSLVSIIQSRGAVLACALPWLRSLLLQHASGIMSQESSLLALNSLYQLIESRVSTFQSARQVSSCLDVLYAGIINDEVEENDKVTPIIYQDKDETDEEDSEDVMETDHDSNEKDASDEALDGVTDFEGIDDISD
ncbi:Utp12 domain-containing protein [Cephalotus follicularis]|uniref:Utp12 domain-containing protein n=1 Tax=Cephalotus follicularis TaxID=3775 RepID=A0A1Q3BDQ7_CEPFO|nr:Utp12 domain-containing protein [Cephalotus follicularis]